MSRRDTIIVAVLVNTGLLAILFMLAVHSDKTLDPVPPEVNEIVLVDSKPNIKEVIVEKKWSIEPRDEVDQMLKNYNSEIPQSVAVAENVEVAPIPDFSKSPLPVAMNIEQSKPNTNKDYVEVTVKRGDYLEKIAKANGTTIEAIMKANKLSSERLDIGQMLKIPLAKKKSSETKKSVPKQTEISL